MKSIIVNAIHWFVRALKIYKDRGQPRNPFVPATVTRTDTFIKCDVCANIDQAYGCCTKAVAPFTRCIVHSVEMHGKRRVRKRDVILKSIRFVWRIVRHFWIHLRPSVLESGPCMNDWVERVIRRRNEAVNWRIVCSDLWARHRAANKRNFSCVAVICGRIDRSIILSARDDTMQVSLMRFFLSELSWLTLSSLSIN